MTNNKKSDLTSHKGLCVCMEGGGGRLCTVQACVSVGRGGGSCVQHISYKPVCVGGGGGCVQYISYKLVCVYGGGRLCTVQACVSVGGGGEVVYSTLAISLCVGGGKWCTVH